MSDRTPGVTDTVALIEPHDSRVTLVTISADGSATLEFDSLSVYHRINDLLYEIWQYSATLTVTSVEALNLTGEIAWDIQVDDGVYLRTLSKSRIGRRFSRRARQRACSSRSVKVRSWRSEGGPLTLFS